MIEWEKYGFKEDETGNGFYSREGFPLALAEEDGNSLTVYIDLIEDGCFREISKGQIPATNQAVVLLLKAFNVPKNG